MKSFEVNLSSSIDDSIWVEAGKFKGNMKAVKQKIEEFFSSHKVECDSDGCGGSGKLHVDDKMLRFDPGGIDVSMMDKFLWENFNVDIIGNHAEAGSE